MMNKENNLTFPKQVIDNHVDFTNIIELARELHIKSKGLCSLMPIDLPEWLENRGTFKSVESATLAFIITSYFETMQNQSNKS